VIEEPILEALRAALRSNEPVRLVKGAGKNAQPGLFPNRSGANAKSIKRCLEGERPLLKVEREEHAASKKGVPIPYVSLTDEGIKLLVRELNVTEWPLALRESAPRYLPIVLDRCTIGLGNRAGKIDPSTFNAVTQSVLSVASEYSDSLESKLRIQLDAHGSLIASIQRFAEAATGRLDRLTKELTVQRSSLSRIRFDLEQSGGSGETGSALAQPQTQGELDFHRSLCSELVFAWRDSPDTGVKTALERTMQNVGVERLGVLGERLPFDGLWMAALESVVGCDVIEIVESGWQLNNPRGTLLLAHARVRPTKKPVG